MSVEAYAARSEAEVVDVVRAARAARLSLSISGGGTRNGLGRPVDDARVLDLSGLSGITLYEPAEMVIAARAGTPLAEVEAVLADKGQRLAFEPMDHRAIYGGAGRPTIGAIAACNLSGPRRVKEGAARDHLIGVRFVNGYAEALSAGGRVMKNVTGLDLVKLMSGAFGTLGALTEVTFKVAPRPDRSATLRIEGLSDQIGMKVLATALASPFEVSGAAHLPAGLFGAAAATLIRLESFASSVAYRSGRLAELIGVNGNPELMGEDEAATVWRDIRDAKPLASNAGDHLWRLSVPASLAASVVAEVAAAQPVRALYDWGGGLVWLAVLAQADSGAPLVRAATKRARGHAMLVRAPAAVRRTVDVFEPQPAALMALTARTKLSFDPDRLFNPGRMYAGL